MIPKQLIQAAVAAALIAAASGQVPKFIQTLRVAQGLQLQGRTANSH